MFKVNEVKRNTKKKHLEEEWQCMQEQRQAVEASWSMDHVFDRDVS